MRKPKTANVAKKADEYLNALADMDRFSGAALIAKDGKVLFSKGYGMANREHSAPNTPQTKFRLGSITKQFTAMAILILEERERLSVADPISKYISESPPAWQGITIRHLLNHTSGIPNYTNSIDWRTTARMSLTPLEIIEPVMGKSLDFRPGERQSYSNSGYILLGHIIEVLSGKTYAEYLQQHIFGPLGMKSSGYDQNETIIEDRATGYGRRGDSWINSDFLDMSVPHAAGALYSTVEDLLLWDNALYTERLISQSTLKAMASPTAFVTNYGYGVGNGKEFDKRFISHAGGIHGFRTNYIRFPEDRACIVALCNLETANSWSVTRDLAAMLFDQKYEMPKVRPIISPPTASLDRLCGRYELASGNAFDICRCGSYLRVALSERAEINLHPESETIFFRKENDDQVTFEIDEQGNVTGLVLKQGGIEAAAKRLP